MKMFFAGLVSLISASAFACPTYNGTYECSGDGIEQTLNVKTVMVNGIPQYSIDETQILADGAYHKVNFMGGQYDMSATCKTPDTLTVNVLLDGGDGDSDECGAQKWNLLYTLNWTPKGANISETHSSSTVCQDGKVFPSGVQGSMTCVLQR